MQWFLPRCSGWLTDRLRLSMGGLSYRRRPRLDPVWNHHVQDPVRFWSHDDPDEEVPHALAQRRFGELPRLAPSLSACRERLSRELNTVLSHLRAVHASYWGLSR